MKKSIIKKLFIKLSKVLRYEIIDQSDFSSPTLQKKLNEDLILPHPRMHLRKFVLVPLYSINRNWKHPIFKKKADLLISKIKPNQIIKEK